MKRQLLPLLALLLAACASTQTATVDPDKPFVFRVRPLDPPPAIMAVWLSELEQCSGLKAEGGPIKYLTAEKIIARGEAKLASIHGDSITLRVDVAKVKRAVQHEQMHWLLRKTPTTSDHPPQYFNGLCGDLGI